MAQPLLFKELEFNRENLRKWAEQKATDEPIVTQWLEPREDGTPYEGSQPNTALLVLRDTYERLLRHQAYVWHKESLLDSYIDLLRDGVQQPISQMPIEDLLRNIAEESEGYDTLETIEDFEALPFFSPNW